MKRMEMKIALTSLIMLVIGVVINGIYSVVSMNSSFFTFEVLASGFVSALFYLFYIWINTIRHKILAVIGITYFGLMFIFMSSSFEEVASSFSNWNWRDTIMSIFFIASYQIASYQGNKLLEEDNNIRLFSNAEEIEAENTEMTVD